MPGKFGDTDASSVNAPCRKSCNDRCRISCSVKHPASRAAFRSAGRQSNAPQIKPGASQRRVNSLSPLGPFGSPNYAVLGAYVDFYEDFILPVFYRSLPELLPPTGENGVRLAFRFDKAEARECRVPFNEELASSGDPRVWAESYAGFIRAFSEPVVTSGLPNTTDRPQLVEELYARMVNRFAADPGRYEFHFISLGALLTRV
jgi:hypothetical protein